VNDLTRLDDAFARVAPRELTGELGQRSLKAAHFHSDVWQPDVALALGRRASYASLVFGEGSARSVSPLNGSGDRAVEPVRHLGRGGLEFAPRLLGVGGVSPAIWCSRGALVHREFL
jgi:hypothetical protein